MVFDRVWVAASCGLSRTLPFLVPSLIVAIGAIALPTPGLTEIPIRDRTLVQTDPISVQLLGKWLAPDALTGNEELTFMFTPSGELFFIVRLPTGELAAQVFQYRLYPNTQPIGIDLILPGGEVVATILELTDSGQMRFQMAGTAPGQPRPTAFTPAADVFSKISDDTNLPAEIVERDTEEIMSRLASAQRTYHLEFDTFASELEPLSTEVPAETEDYSYAVVPQGDGTQSVMMTATAKREDLRSYTSAVYMVPNDRNFLISVAAVCATDTPSSTPPAMPETPASPDKDAIVCPPGSTQL
jgi:hypothetical protein